MSNKLSFGRDAAEFLKNLLSDRDSEDEECLDRADGIYITSLKALGDDRIALSIRVQNSSGREEIEFVLLYEIFERLELSLGAVDTESMAEIEFFADVTSAYFSACSSFAFSQSSLRALERKLIQKGFSREVSEEAIKIVASKGFVNEDEIVQSRVRVFLDKHWGRSRILSKLREEGFSDPAVDSAVFYLEDIDFSERCATVITRKFGSLPEDRRDREKMYASLSRLGYSGLDIKRALRKLTQNE